MGGQYINYENSAQTRPMIVGGSNAHTLFPSCVHPVRVPSLPRLHSGSQYVHNHVSCHCHACSLLMIMSCMSESATCEKRQTLRTTTIAFTPSLSDPIIPHFLPSRHLHIRAPFKQHCNIIFCCRISVR